MGAVRLTVAELPEGGYVVLDPAPVPGVMDTPMFAASTVEDALAFIRMRFRREREKAPAAHGLHGPVSGLSLDTSDLVQHGRNAMAEAVGRRNGHLPS